MRFFSRSRSAVRNLFRKRQVESSLDEEVRAYIAMIADERVSSGMPVAEARRTALAESGGVEQVKQAVREERAGVGLELLWQDVRYGWRQLRHNRGFTLTAVITLGLGIGATTAIFSAVYSLLLRPLPYPDAGRLMYVSSHSAAGKGDIPNMLMSPDYVAAKAQIKSFQELAAYQYGVTNLRDSQGAVRVTDASVTASFLSTLGVIPQLGRVFTNLEDHPEGATVVLLGDRFWRNHFHADPAVVGKVVDVGGVAQTIVGVLPQHFTFPSLAVEPDVYTAVHLDRDTSLSVEKPVLGMQVVGRLKPGMSVQQAQAEMQSFFLARVKEYPAVSRGAFAGRKMMVEPLQRHMVGDNRKPLYILLVCVGAVLLIACANVANLQLARAVSRRHETALRGSLGASRLRLIRQFLVESLILSSLAAALGFTIAWFVTSMICRGGLLDGLQSRTVQNLRVPFGKMSASIEMDGWVLAFTVGLALLTTLLFGLAPALGGTRVDLRNALQSAAMRISAGREQRVFRHALLVVEVALAVVLLASASLLMRSFVNVLRYDSGFDPGETLTGVTLMNDSSTPPQVRTFVDALLPRLRALPGVEAAAITSALPLEGADGVPVYFGNGPTPPIGTWQDVSKISVTPDYFRAFGITLFQGRAFSTADNEGSPHVAVVNRTFAQRFLSGGVLGRQIHLNLWGDTPYQFAPVTIVGIADDVRQGGLEQEVKPVLFLPEAQSADGEINIALRTKSDPDLLANAMRQAVLAVDTKQPLFDIQTMEGRISGAVAQRRLMMLLIACFALLAVVLSAVGVYGTFAYSVSQRSQEMGIRLALGASRSGLLRLVVMQAAWLIAVGGVIGMGAALLLSRLLAGLLVGVTAHDAFSFAMAWGLMTVVALLASAVPAADAARTDLVSVLRAE